MGSQRRSSEIELVVRCDCGFEARGTESRLVPSFSATVAKRKMQVSRDQVLAMAKPA